ncbi:MAG: uroporphyrinogen decarboxylase family protein [Thermoguttaceae bacterium]|jgi:uroporphyrinogen decarboxylase
MTSRDRVLAALAHRPTDRVPRLLYEEAIGYPPPVERLVRERCAPRDPRDYFAMDLTRVVENPSRLPLSRFAPWLAPEAETALASGQVDPWGVWWRPGSLHHFAHIESPLKAVREPAQLDEYPWPDLQQPYRFEGVSGRVAAWHERGLAVVAFAGSIFEQAWYLRGMQQFLVDMYEQPELAHALLERTAACQRYAAEQFARAGVDIVLTGDDVATQTGLMLRIEMWREYLKPLQTATARAVKQANPACRVFYHCDGNVAALIPDLIETGIDILNPLQPECMLPAAIKERYGDRLSFWGTVSVQKTMAFAAPEAVRAEVRERIRTVGRGGGLILAPAHVLPPEVAWENIVAFFEAADREPLPE